ncbi:MAG: hypothetical protein M1817_004412 [Caeruleum heppii]|nr:MAG: hypothetical protein M1817_004412 [Caeruleum heppii]
MADIGLPPDTGISPMAVSQAFPLFSQEAIEIMRAEVLSEKLRGHCPGYSKFVYDAWNAPETLSIISTIAGIDLVPNMDYEIGHVNISGPATDHGAAKNTTFPFECEAEEERPVVDWHHDSYPFVCVLMLSDASTMVGGETALRTGHGEILKVRGPQKGSAIVLQGRYIEHQALPASGATERITMVTSFRPRSFALPDDTVLTTVRPVAKLDELYLQFSEYRLEIMEARIRDKLRQLRETKKLCKKLDLQALKQFLKEQQRFLAVTNDEMVTEDVSFELPLAEPSKVLSGRDHKRVRAE